MKTYFYRFSKDGNWYRAELKCEVNWHSTIMTEVVELQPDGSGKYKRCKEMPIKEERFYKFPEDMTMIALKAKLVTFVQ